MQNLTVGSRKSGGTIPNKGKQMKQYLKNLERLLIEENCHTVNDSQAFAKLLELVERDEGIEPIKTGTYQADCRCGATLIKKVHVFCPYCGMRIIWGK